MNIFTTLRNAWKTSDLKAKIVFTCFIIILFRIGINIPVPFVNTDALQSFFSSQSSTLLGYFNMLSGNALAYGTLFALTIQPYINASRRGPGAQLFVNLGQDGAARRVGAVACDERRRRSGKEET